MNAIPIIVLLALAVMGGVVALVGDRIGRKLGKKRLSLLGMRPRRTAETFTMLAGALIPLVTVGIVMSLSQSVREWVLESGQVLRQRDEQQRELQQGAIVLKDERQKLAQTEAQLKPLLAKVASLQITVSSEQSQVALKSSQLRTTNAEYNRVHGAFLVVTNQLAKLHQNLDHLQTTLGTLRNTYAGLQKTYADLQASYDSLQKSYAVVQAQSIKAKSARDVAVAERDKAQQDLQQVKKQIADTEAQLADTKTQLDQTTATLDSTKNELAEDQAQLQKVTASMARLIPFTEVSRSVPVIFNVDEELARAYVPPMATQQDAQAIIEGLIEDASSFAEKRGAEARTPGGHAADLIPLPSGKESNEYISVPQIEAQLVKEMSGKDYPQALIAVAYFNTTVGEVVPLDIRVVNNPLVFRKNEAIAEGVINGDLTDNQIYSQISNFLQDKVGEKAKEAKMIPVQGSDQKYGNVPPGDMISLINKIHNWGRSVRLIALASDDTHAADPLALRFDLR